MNRTISPKQTIYKRMSPELFKLTNMAQNGKVSLREATLDDYEAVCAIDTLVYDGSDYIPNVFHKYMQDPTRICYVLEINGKIVSALISLIFLFFLFGMISII